MIARQPSPLDGPLLGRGFFARPVLTVARACIGQVLVRATAEGVTAGRIVECEAYRGPDDRAAHSAGGRRTRRTEAMYGPPGHAYVFALYGMHWAMNVVTGRLDEPHAVLIRALEPVAGVELMAERRGLGAGDRAVANGPGKLCQALAIDGSVYGADLCTRSGLYLLGGDAGALARSPRINVDYAGTWAARPWRFYEKGNRHVSVPPRH